MASGRRRRIAALVRSEVLADAALTNVNEGDRGITANQSNLANLGLYNAQGYTPVFANGDTGILSDADSNSDGTFTVAGLTGETTNAAAMGIGVNTVRFSFPRAGSVQLDASSSGVPTSGAIIYSIDGPKANYVPYYLGETTATGSIKFGSQITGTGAPTGVKVSIFGELSTNDQIRCLTGSTVLFVSGVSPAFAMGAGLGTASATQLPTKSFVIPTGSIPSGFVLEFSSSAKTSLTLTKGVVVTVVPVTTVIA
jgi:hypothetical protein